MIIVVACLVFALSGLVFWFRRMAQAGRKRVAMILRLENPDVLRGNHGASGLAEIIAAIARNLASDLRARAPVQTTGSGEFRVMLGELSPREALQKADIVRAICESGIRGPSGRILPALTGALVCEQGDEVPEQRLFDFGRMLLGRCGPGGTGLISVVNFDVAELVAEQPLRPLFSPEWLEMRYHARACTDTGAIIAAEVEPVLNHPDLGLMESTAFLSRIGSEDRAETTRETIRQALAAMRDWDGTEAGLDSLTIRIGDDQIVRNDFSDVILWELDRQDIAPSRLVIAVGNGAGSGMRGGSESRNLQRLTSAGCGIELDEFGLGGSNVETLRRLGARSVRIGRNFVRDCDHVVEQQRMILAILALGEHFGLRTTAIGVDSAHERSFLTQIGVSMLQGDAISPRLDRQEMTAFLTEHGRPAPIKLPIRQVG